MKQILPSLCGALLLTSAALAADVNYDSTEMFSPQDTAKIRKAYDEQPTFSISLVATAAQAGSFDPNEAFSPARVEQIRAAYDERPLSDRGDAAQAGF